MLNKDEMKGKVQKIKGSAKQKIGRAVGNRDLEAEGRAERTEGRVREGTGKARRKIGETIQKAGRRIAGKP